MKRILTRHGFTNGPSTLSERERFAEKVERCEGDGCFLWKSAKTEAGYGAFYFRGSRQRAHRVAWVLERGDIPEDASILHRCDNPACVRVSHLFLGSQADNLSDMVGKGRHGHTVLTKDKWRRLALMRKKHGRRLSVRRIAQWFGLSEGTVFGKLSPKKAALLVT